MVIITDLEQKQKSASNAENTTDLPKNLQVPQGYFWDGPEPFFEKTTEDRLNLI